MCCHFWDSRHRVVGSCSRAELRAAHMAGRFERVGIAGVLRHEAHCLSAQLRQVAAVDGVHIIGVCVQLHRQMPAD